MVVRAISGPEINPIHPERTVPTAAADIATPAPAPKATTELPGGSKRAPTRQLSGLVLAAHKKQLQEAETQLTILKQVLSLGWLGMLAFFGWKRSLRFACVLRRAVGFVNSCHNVAKVTTCR